MRHQVFVNALRAHKEGGCDLPRDHEGNEQQRQFPPFAYAVHDVREFRRVPAKWEAK